MAEERAVLALTIENPQTLGDLDAWAAHAHLLGIPPTSPVVASHRTLHVRAFLDQVEPS